MRELLSQSCTLEFFFVVPTTSIESDERIVPLSGEIIDIFSESAEGVVGAHDPGVTSMI